MHFNAEFSEPQSHWPSPTIRPPSAIEGAPRTRRELPLGGTPRSRLTRGGQVSIPGSEIPPCIYNSNNPGTKTGSPGSTPPRTVWKLSLIHI